MVQAWRIIGRDQLEFVIFLFEVWGLMFGVAGFETDPSIFLARSKRFEIRVADYNLKLQTSNSKLILLKLTFSSSDSACSLP